MRTFESNKWYYVKEPSDLPTEEEFGDNRVMVREANGRTASFIKNELSVIDKGKEGRIFFCDFPQEEPDVCPVCGKKDNFYHTEEYSKYKAGCHDIGDHEIYVTGTDRVDCVRKWNAIPRGGNNG